MKWRARFSLRTLLIVTTVIAAGLGLIVWATRYAASDIAARQVVQSDVERVNSIVTVINKRSQPVV